MKLYELIISIIFNLLTLIFSLIENKNNKTPNINVNVYVFDSLIKCDK